MRLYEMRETLRNSGRAVFTTRQLSVVLGVPRGHAKVYASRLVARGWAWRPMRGRVAITRDDFALATQLVEPSYVTAHSALHLRGMLDQVPREVECATPRLSLRLDRLGIRYRKIHPTLFFGYERVERGLSYAFVASPEKALLDMVYFGYSPTEWGFADPRELRRMAEAYERLGTPRARRVIGWVREVAR